MNQSYKFYWLICFSFLLACKGKQPEQNTTTATVATTPAQEIPVGIITSVTCSNAASYSYHIYLPKSYTKENKFPLILFFDAHKKSKLPLKNYQSIADKLNYIYICSDQAENGLPIETYHQIGDALLQDVKSKVSVDENKIYTAGFSGGARVALDYATKNLIIKGVILNSAGFDPRALPANTAFKIVGLGGAADFNLSEMYQSFANIFSQPKHLPAMFLLFNGKHEWAPKINMELALEFLLDESATADQDAMDEFMRISKDLAPALITENNIKNEYITELSRNAQPEYWRKTIYKLEKSPKYTSPTGVAMVKRLKGFLSIYCYSNTNGAIKANQLDIAQQFAELYAVVDQTNAEWAYLQAIIAARKRQENSCLEKLNIAAQLHFNDKDRMAREPDFASLSGNPKFQEILGKLEKDVTND